VNAVVSQGAPFSSTAPGSAPLGGAIASPRLPGAFGTSSGDVELPVEAEPGRAASNIEPSHPAAAAPKVPTRRRVAPAIAVHFEAFTGRVILNCSRLPRLEAKTPSQPEAETSTLEFFQPP
jgi:hypothetical protein